MHLLVFLTASLTFILTLFIFFGEQLAGQWPLGLVFCGAVLALLWWFVQSNRQTIEQVARDKDMRALKQLVIGGSGRRKRK